MRKVILLSVSLIGLAVVGCLGQQENNIPEPTASLYAKTSVPPVPTAGPVDAFAETAVPPVPSVGSPMGLPVRTFWQIGDHPIALSGDFIFAVHAVVLTGQQTTVLYSLSGPTASTTLANSSVQLNDDAKQTHALSKITTLAQLARLQLGIITFGPRHGGIRELHVLIRPSAQAAPLDMIVAKLVGSPAEDSHGAVLAASRDGYLEQGGYRISFNGWSLYKGDIVADRLSAKGMTVEEILHQRATEAASHPVQPRGTPTPVPVDPAALQLSGGNPILDEATLRIEDSQSHQVQFLYLVFLADGEVKATLLQ
jgi:hypothetical protein